MDRTGALPTSYSAKRPLIFRGDCQAVVRVRGGREGVYRDYEECECTWFLEDLERVRLDAKQAKKDKKPVGRPRKDGSPAGSPREKKRPKYYDKIVW